MKLGEHCLYHPATFTDIDSVSPKYMVAVLNIYVPAPGAKMVHCLQTVVEQLETV